MTIGEKIKRLRIEKHMTQEELGVAVGVQKAAINKYETGIVVNIKRDVIGKLAGALDVNPVWLMDDDDGWPPVPSARVLIARALDETSAQEPEDVPKNDDIRFLVRGLNKLSPEQVEQARNVMKIMFAKYADYFDKENDDET